PVRRPDHRRADPERPAARSGAARRARRAVHLGPRGAGHAAAHRRRPQVHPAQRADHRRDHAGRGARPDPAEPKLRRAVRHGAGSGRAGGDLRAVRRRVLLAAHAGPVRHAGPVPHRPPGGAGRHGPGAAGRIRGTGMIPAVLAGALVGVGLLVLVVALRPPRPSLAVTLARLDAPRDPANESISAAIRAEGLPDWRRRLGARVDAGLAARGITLGRVRSDLAVLGRSMEGFLATTMVLAGLGLVLGPTLIAMFLALGAGVGPALPVG